MTPDQGQRLNYASCSWAKLAVTIKPLDEEALSKELLRLLMVTMMIKHYGSFIPYSDSIMERSTNSGNIKVYIFLY